MERKPHDNEKRPGGPDHGPKTPIEKSHSAWSNTKLTILCFFAALCFALFFVGLGLIGTTLQKIISILLAIVGLLGGILCLVMLDNFRR